MPALAVAGHLAEAEVGGRRGCRSWAGRYSLPDAHAGTPRGRDGDARPAGTARRAPDRARRGASARSALAAAPRPGAPADRGAGAGLPPARQIHPDAARRRRQRAAAPGHVRPHADREGRAQRGRRRTSTWCWRPTTGWRVGFVDPRRFGSVDLVPTAQEDAHKLLAELGPEPLDAAFSAAGLSAALGRPSARRSRRRCWTRRSSPGWATSMSARRCSAPASARCARRTPSPARAPRGWCRRSRRR